MGFVHMPDPEVLGLTPNRDVVPGMDNVYMISAMHQLHCLQKLQAMYARLRDRHQDAASSVNTSSAPSSAAAAADWERNHAAHCFDYLRQGVICAADGTLEGPDADPEPSQSRLRGWGVAHECRSWDDLMAFQRQHAAVPSSDID